MNMVRFLSLVVTLMAVWPVESHGQELAQANPSFDELVTYLVLENMPHKYARDKDWGTQDERWDGIDFRREGWKIETKRKKKKVNHGTWRKYSASLADPENQFSIKVRNFRRSPEEKLVFDVDFKSALKLDARQSKWVKGVQIYSLSAEGKAKVRLSVSIELETQIDPTRLPPDLIFAPTATAAKLSVDEFRIDSISKVGGELAQQVTRAARKELDKEIEEKQHELVEKINKLIEKNKDDLRLSIVDALDSQWTDKAREFLPPTIRGAIDAAERNR